MKKIIIWIALFFSIILNIMLFNKNLNYKQQFRALYQQNYEKEEALLSLGYQIADQESIKEELLLYETLLLNIIQYDVKHAIESVYSCNVMYEIQGETYPVPMNGIIFVDEEEVTVKIEVKTPPVLRNQEINDYLSQNHWLPIEKHFGYPAPQRMSVEEASARITYEMEYGQTVDIRPSIMMLNYFDFPYDQISIVSIDKGKLPKGGAYFPSRDMIVSLKNQTLTYKVTGDRCEVLQEKQGEHQKMYYDLRGEVTMTGTSSSDVPLNLVILPDVVCKGYSWRSGMYDYVIEEDELWLDGYECIVVKQYLEGQFNQTFYFGRDIGLIEKGGIHIEFNIKNSQ